MSFLGLGGKKIPKPLDLAKSTRDILLSFEKHAGNAKAVEKASEELTKNVAMLKVTLYGDPEHGQEVNPENAAAISSEIYAQDLIPLILTHLGKLEFEAKKEVVSIFGQLLRRNQGGRSPTVDYIVAHPAVIDQLTNGYESPDIALSTGAMLRECSRVELLCRLVFASPAFWKFFKFIESSNFDVASDAFSTFKELLTKHKTAVAEFLEKHYDLFFKQYTCLLSSANYVTRRQSVKLLGELLLDRANFNVMTSYIGDHGNLKLMMQLLRDKSKSIQFEAFHVFKVFVANPNKPAKVLGILQKNRDKLVSFLQGFQNDKEEEQFNEEKTYLLKQIQALPPLT
eukprot:TRINITY_DN8921_c0_g1_i1.p1 TRINITY_DN8921_c0_g1~~TRINITY_DN8921_c0_g1_i1.p1  ORF type:complete len:341 (-),score=9.26 TRINITY_DN8921_c0_g1_i1:12-1034(-)